MNKSINVGFVQFEVTNNIGNNISVVVDEINRLAIREVDFVVLPELWSCGFNYDILSSAAGKTPEILTVVAELAKDNNVTIIGSLPESSDGKIYNTAICIGSNGDIISRYKKIHLFPPLKEDEHFTPGKDISTFLVKGVKVGVVICFDLRFPELIHKLAVSGISVLAVCAQWPKVRYLHWVTLLKARAIENQIFVVASNRCGIQNDREFLGHSIIINPYGETIYEAHEYEESMDAFIDLTLIERFKRQFDCISLSTQSTRKHKS